MKITKVITPTNQASLRQYQQMHEEEIASRWKSPPRHTIVCMCETCQELHVGYFGGFDENGNSTRN